MSMRDEKMKSGSGLETLIRENKFVITAEIMPPKTPNSSILKKKTNYVLGAVTAVNLTDNQSAMVRMSSMIASKIVMDAGIEPVMQITCRDRNRLAIQSDVLGASAIGIKNILCVTGDHQCFGNHPDAKNVYDIDSIQLLRMLKNMRDKGCFQNNTPIKNRKKGELFKLPLFIGAAANPFGYPRKFRPYRLLKKVNAGADFIQTQPVYNMNAFKDWLQRIIDLGLHERTAILAGITPVRSAQALIFMNEKVPGMYIPDDVIKRMKQAEDPKMEGFNIAKETIQELCKLPGISGIHFMAIGWEKIVPKLIKTCNLQICQPTCI